MSSPHLPEDLLRDICLLAASNDTGVGFVLTQVANRIRNWVEPLVYEVVIYDSEQNLPINFVPAHHRPTVESISTFGHHVRHLLLSESSDEITAIYLKFCTSANDVGIWGCKTLSPEMAQFVLSNYTFYRFSGEPFLLFTKDFVRSPSFALLTHLDQRVACVAWDTFQAITELPNLTHLAVDPCVEMELVDGALAGCKKLKLFVFVATGWHLDSTDSFEDWWKQSRTDKRIVCVAAHDQVDYWVQYPKGGKDMWEIAEEKCEAWSSKGLPEVVEVV